MTEDSRSLDHHANTVARHPQAGPFEGCVCNIIYSMYTVYYTCIGGVVRNVNDLRSSRSLCKRVNNCTYASYALVL